jgi:hypothetical protein
LKNFRMKIMNNLNYGISTDGNVQKKQQKKNNQKWFFNIFFLLVENFFLFYLLCNLLKLRIYWKKFEIVIVYRFKKINKLI